MIALDAWWAWANVHELAAFLQVYLAVSAFFSALKPKNPTQFDAMAKRIGARNVRLIIAIAAGLSDLLKFAKEMIGFLANQSWSAEAERALKSLPPPPPVPRDPL